MVEEEAESLRTEDQEVCWEIFVSEVSGKLHTWSLNNMATQARPEQGQHQ